MQRSKVIFGTSGLGNLYVALSDAVKTAIVQKAVACAAHQPVFDTAGKYGAGLALQSLGKALKTLNIAREKVTISNKLGWLQTPLNSATPQFEPGVWKDIHHDARQMISYDGITACYEQGNQLLNGYEARMVSVHDPDEYLAAAKDTADAAKRYADILDAYRALFDLKAAGKVDSVGVGAKDWQIIRRICTDIDLDWIMIANSMTIYSHPAELLVFLEGIARKGVTVINSAVFNAGFLTGGKYFNYRLLDPVSDHALFAWRETFFQTCAQFQIQPAAACIAFALKVPGVSSIALNTTNPDRIQQNVDMANGTIPAAFWQKMQSNQLVDKNLSFLP